MRKSGPAAESEKMELRLFPDMQSHLGGWQHTRQGGEEDEVGEDEEEEGGG